MKLEHINNILEMLVGDVQMYNVQHSYKGGETYNYLRSNTTGKQYFNLEDKMDDIDALIKEAWKLKRHKYVPLSITTADIGATVYVDRMTPICINSIFVTTKQIIITSEGGVEYPGDRLWIRL